MAAAAPVAVALASACGRFRGPARRVVMLGVDGMDPFLTRRFIGEGLMPSCARLASMGGLNPLATEMPPQSPVAWSAFITGSGSEVHGIYDFIHREPGTLEPHLSTTRVTPSSRHVDLGGTRLPLDGARLELLRTGEPFWHHLTREGMQVELFRLPVDFPPSSAGGARLLSGLGVPDARGGQGSFTLFTDDARSLSDDTSGGVTVAVRSEGGIYRCRLEGPPDQFSSEGRPAVAELTVTVDRSSGGALVETGCDSVLLGTGEWSGWRAVEFPLLGGLRKVRTLTRIYLASVDPHLRLYLSPLNLDPSSPSMPLSSPAGLSRELAALLGPFHTKGFPEDTKALSRGVLDDISYIGQAVALYGEQLEMMRLCLSRCSEGLSFCYFSTLDLNQHAFYRDLDPLSPLHSSVHPEARGFVQRLYSMIDSAVGEAMDMLDGRTLLLVFSDHGFAPFRRGFNLNTWLLREGYASVSDPFAAREELFRGTDWRSTAAYGLGINSLYLNLRGREPGGSVEPSEARAVLHRIRADLEAVVDPLTGLRPVACTSAPDPVPGQPHAPDLLIGYATGYRASWDTTLGRYPDEVIEDNLDPWSGDHCMAPAAVPGVLLSSEPVHARNPRLRDLGRTAVSWLGPPTLPPGVDLLDLGG